MQHPFGSRLGRVFRGIHGTAAVLVAVALAGCAAGEPLQAPPAGSYLVLFVPSGYDDMEDFRAAARQAAEGLDSIDWYRDYVELFSFSTYESSTLNRIAVLHCDLYALVSVEPAAAVAEAYVMTAGARFGTVRRSPDLIVFVVNHACRAAALGSFILLDRGAEPLVLAHEIGHAMANLDDEYAEEGRPCTGTINAAPRADIGWQCQLQGRPVAALCPDGSSAVCGDDVCDGPGETCRNCPADCGTCTPDCSWYSCTDTCGPTGTPNATACNATTTLPCRGYCVESVCEAHAPECSWYVCTSSCWPTGTSNDLACNSSSGYRTTAACDAH